MKILQIFKGDDRTRCMTLAQNGENEEEQQLLISEDVRDNPRGRVQ